MIELGIPEILWSALLVVAAIAVTLWWKIPVQKDMAIGSVRTFIQLIAVGYALKYIFDLQSPWLIHLAILVMTFMGAYTVASRLKDLKGAMLISFVSISVGSFITIGLLLLLRVITFEPRYVIPLAGMIISNAMNATALTIDRIRSDIGQNREAIESGLALGQSWREASRKFQKAAVMSGMISILNFLKTAGIVALPGAMTGMILAGVEPMNAVLLQILVAYMLLAAVTFSSIVALELTVRRFFTANHQLLRD